MRRRPQPSGNQSISLTNVAPARPPIGLVLSGGGSRAAYQVGALRALEPYIRASGSPIVAIMGSSVGAINGLLLASCLKNGLDSAIAEIESLWVERTYRNTFAGSPSRAFLRAVKTAVLKYASPGPEATTNAIFDPTPLIHRIDSALDANGGLTVKARDPQLLAVGVMTTIEGKERKPLLFVNAKERLDNSLLAGASFEVLYVEQLFGKHGLASAALPSVLPPVELDVEVGKVRLVDGGISQNIPVDPAVRFGAERVIILDISGRQWWHDQYGEQHDKRPDWEVPASMETFCFRPPESFVVRNGKPFGPILKAAVSQSTRDFIGSLGASWPIFTLLKRKMGEDLAFEVMSYVALHPDYARALVELGYNETLARLRDGEGMEFSRIPGGHGDVKTGT